MNTRKLYRVKATMEYFAFAHSEEEAVQYANAAIGNAVPRSYDIEAGIVLSCDTVHVREGGEQVYHDADDNLTLEQAYQIQTGRTFKQARKIDREHFKPFRTLKP